MRRHTRTATCGALIAAALLSVACGGGRKNADAGAAHQHGTSTTATAANHSAHTSTDPHAGMNHGNSTTGGAVDHTAHTGGAAVDHAAMGHGTTADPHAAHRASGGANGRSSMDHSSMDHSKMDHAAMGHAPQAASHESAHAQHGTTTRGGNAHAQHGATARGGNAHAQHGATARGGNAHAQHGSTAAADAHAQHRQQTTGAHAQHNATEHAEHNSPTASADPHAQHGTAAPRGAHAGHGAHGATASTASAMATAPRSSTELQRVQPAATLQPDAFDAPAPAAITEARKATQGGGHEGHATRGITPGEDHANPPTPMPATLDRSNTPASGVEHEHHGATAAQTRGATRAEEAVYFCPMDTEVTSARPGNCPKCGMALVKKD